MTRQLSGGQGSAAAITREPRRPRARWRRMGCEQHLVRSVQYECAESLNYCVTRAGLPASELGAIMSHDSCQSHGISTGFHPHNSNNPRDQSLLPRWQQHLRLVLRLNEVREPPESTLLSKSKSRRTDPTIFIPFLSWRDDACYQKTKNGL